VPRGSRVVYEIEKRKSSTRFNTRSASDDLPAPEGADTTIKVPRSGWAAVDAGFSLDILALLPQLLYFGLDYYGRVAYCKVV
jgi:hypothetical protein